MNKEYWNPMVPELSVSDYDRSRRFYTEVLGFSTRYERVNPDFSYLELENVHLMIQGITEETWVTGCLEKPLGRGINFQIELTDISVAHKKLKLIEYPLFRELKESWYQAGLKKYGQKEFLIQDPDGYLLRLSQYIGEKNA